MEKNKHCIVGAGLVGSLLSVILSEKGFDVDVWERRSDIRDFEIIAGKSINLALSTRGFKALELAGLSEEVRKLCIPMHGRMIHDTEGNTRFMAYGKEGEYINSVSRGGLNQLLLSKADEKEHVNLYFDERCEDVNFKTGEIHFKNTQTHQDTHKKYDLIFGTDGAFSAARLGLMKTERFDFNYQQDYLEHGYKELSIPPAENGGWLIDKDSLHIWPRGRFMMIALPNLDGSFTCTLFLDFNGPVSFEQLKDPASVTAFFQTYFPDALPLMPTLMEDFFENPTSSLITVRCSPWHYDDMGVLMGDAAHAIVPFYGQGMNAGFEDCTVLNELIEQYGEDWKTIFSEFSRLRKPNADAIADLAVRNFIEMRDLVADPDFILKNKIDKRMGMLFPKKWLPLYSMVTFSNMSYSEAKQKGNEHDAILEAIVKENPNIEQLINEEKADDIISKYVK